jgi:hypothetical protein
MTRTSCTGLLLVALGVSACRQPPGEPGQRTAAPVAPAKALVPLAASPAPDPKLARIPLGDRLALEADARPAEAVRLTQLELALQERGVTIVRKRQVLASTLGAAYCELAVSREGLAISVCEYADARAAALGGKRSQHLFDALIPGRTLVTRGNTLLTIMRPAGELAERQTQLVLTVFSEQTPTALQTATALAR